MVDSVEMIRFFTEFILSQKSRPFVSLRVTRRRVQNDKHGIFPIVTQPPKGEGIIGKISSLELANSLDPS